jgi:hypothetical protein
LSLVIRLGPMIARQITQETGQRTFRHPVADATVRRNKPSFVSKTTLKLIG